LKYYNNIISFKEEFYSLYNKLLNEKIKLLNSEISNINALYNEINKNKTHFENMKLDIVKLINSQNQDETN